MMASCPFVVTTSGSSFSKTLRHVFCVRLDNSDSNFLTRARSNSYVSAPRFSQLLSPKMDRYISSRSPKIVVYSPVTFLWTDRISIVVVIYLSFSSKFPYLLINQLSTVRIIRNSLLPLRTAVLLNDPRTSFRNLAMTPTAFREYQ